MTEEVTKQDVEQEVNETPKRGRPKKENKKRRRVSVAGGRDVLTVEGKDPAYRYYWVCDYNEDGARINTFLEAGYEFVKAGTHRIGAARAGDPQNVGSVERKPSGHDRDGNQLFLYLMRQPLEWYKEDKQEKLNEIKRRSTQFISEYQKQTGVYGDIKLSD